MQQIGKKLASKRIMLSLMSECSTNQELTHTQKFQESTDRVSLDYKSITDLCTGIGEEGLPTKVYVSLEFFTYIEAEKKVHSKGLTYKVC